MVYTLKYESHKINLNKLPLKATCLAGVSCIFIQLKIEKGEDYSLSAAM